ncbi:spore coat protein U domain-containing protein [Serratia inhibens]
MCKQGRTVVSIDRWTKKIMSLILASVCAASPVRAFEWTAVDDASGSILTYFIMKGRDVDVAHCKWLPVSQWGWAHAIYADHRGLSITGRYKGELSSLRPKNCEEAVKLINRADIWDKPLYTEPRGLAGPGVDRVMFTLHANGTGGPEYPWGYAMIEYWVPPEPSVPSCSVQDPRDVSFGTVEASDVSGRRANGSITVKCTKPTTVTIRFTSRSGQDLVTLAEGLNAKLRVSEKDGSVGYTYLNSGAVPNFSILSATLSSPNGAPKTGAFNYTAVVRVELH